MPLLIFIYSMMWQLFCKYELPFWQDVSVESLILKDRSGPLASYFSCLICIGLLTVSTEAFTLVTSFSNLMTN